MKSLWLMIGFMLFSIIAIGIGVFGYLTAASPLLIPASVLVAFGLVGAFLSLRVNVSNLVMVLGAMIVFQGMRTVVTANHWMRWQTHHHAVALALVWVNRGAFLACVLLVVLSFYQMFV